ncbi:27069_t:CDS:2 [Racocetra persica]|uniref:27069_t:CDS:1 n=1 Tax=Racocetra persica TaxID=160502 RepID=A0ACA9L1N4_9GLOM|nr:27069_t:CDS:2 [Racocetra persica]
MKRLTAWTVDMLPTETGPQDTPNSKRYNAYQPVTAITDEPILNKIFVNRKGGKENHFLMPRRILVNQYDTLLLNVNTTDTNIFVHKVSRNLQGQQLRQWLTDNHHRIFVMTYSHASNRSELFHEETLRNYLHMWDEVHELPWEMLIIYDKQNWVPTLSWTASFWPRFNRRIYIRDIDDPVDNYMKSLFNQTKLIFLHTIAKSTENITPLEEQLYVTTQIVDADNGH